MFANTSWHLFNYRKGLIRFLQEDGHEVIVLAPYDEYVSKLLELGVTCYTLPLSQRGKNPLQEIYSCVRVFRLLQILRPAAVLSFTVKCNLYAGICHKFVPFEQISNISGLGEAFDEDGIFRSFISLFYKHALSKSKIVFFQNNEDMQAITERGILPEHICHRIPGSGVDLEIYRPAPSVKRRAVRRFFMFGRLVPQKGYSLFMAVAKEMHLENKGCAEFWIMGMADKSRRESRVLLEEILSLHEQGIITYLPQSDDVVQVLQQVDVVVLPSTYNEGLPRSLLEAMACGKPLITTDWKGCRDTVDHGVNGYLINTAELNTLSDHIQKMASAPEEQFERMGRMSRMKAEMEFNEKIVLDAYRAAIYS